MLTIRCSTCRRKLFKYLKIGSGRVLHCWKHRISEDFTIHDGKEIKCVCGNVIGIDEGKWIKMCQRAFTYTGSKMKK
jgi:hypothetical protein